MFRITEEDYDEMVAVISKCCCFKPHPCPYCSEVDCDVQMIYEILRNHLENKYTKCGKKDICNIDKEWDEDKLPFRA